MLDSFSGVKNIIVQPNTNGATYTFTFSVCSSATANDGFLPYGETISSVAVTAHTESGTDATSSLITGIPTVSSNVVTVRLKYPSAVGTYHLQFVLTLASGGIEEADFNRVISQNL